LKEELKEEWLFKLKIFITFAAKFWFAVMNDSVFHAQIIQHQNP
jgi:hypothetical protein